MKLLVVSDIHGNWSALQSVLDAEADYDKILCLGDLVDYGPEPVACVAWAMKQNNNAISIQGNHDWGVALRKDPRGSPPFRHLTACTQAFSLKVLSFFVMRWAVGRRTVSRRACWDGGIGRLLPEMTYTATGFSNPVRVIFQAI
ncbi:MAG: metallophosphoesterase, partial [Verrucomicrobia bacterium]|nr:metallophosphoesterase [Verrucomicrobiota bacterium]